MKAIVCFLAMGCASVFAQQVSQISGAVNDQSGAVIPDVQITVTQTDTALKRTVTSDSRGLYVIPELPLGPYNLEATKMGFQTFVRPAIR